MRPSSPLSSRACLIETSWRGFWVEMCGSSQRDSLCTWAALHGSVVRQKLCFYESWWCAANERKAAKGQKRKLWLWFRLHSQWQCAIFTLCFFSLFAHSVIFLCKWMKWPNFTRLYWMSRCNLTKCCSESWLYGFSFQTLCYFHFVYIQMFVFVCLLVTVHDFNL